MIQTITELVTFDEFIDWYPENSEHHYELHNGEIVEMPKATGKHSKLTGFLIADLNFEIRRLQLPYFIPKESGRFIGNPKQPTFSVYQLVDGEYQVKLFRNGDRIESPIFPELNLTPQQVFAKGK